MAKKSRIRFTFDSPVTLAFTFLCALVFLLDTFVFKDKIILSYFTCRASSTGAGVPAFDFASPLDYARLILHVFGSASWLPFFLNTGLILVFGPVLEERYGSVILTVMMTTSCVVSGVLTACMGPCAVTGQEALVYMMIFLSLITAFTKKIFPLSSIFIFLLFTGYEFFVHFESSHEIINAVPVCIDLIAGVVGSLFGYLVSPKKRAAKNSQPKEKEPAWTPRKSYSSDETVVGEINL
ncbi:MAG: rhomboid family intramembrane serine protease [Treponema sp.]|nr:rhomboid family intramembrane serine protease [Treponema sp.]